MRTRSEIQQHLAALSHRAARVIAAIGTDDYPTPHDELHAEIDYRLDLLDIWEDN